MDNIKKEIESLKSIAIKAGEAIMSIYLDPAVDFELEAKDDNSPLTKADLAANTIICDHLAKLNPSYPIISEENKQVSYEERKDYEYFWLVDPLDGTKEFIKKNGEFTVNIALIHKQRPVLGIVYVPAKDTLFYGMEGMGAYKVSNNETTKVDSGFFRLDESFLTVVCSRSHLNEETSEFISKFDQHQKVSKGSSLKFLILAEGQAQIYPRLAPTMEWDTAAADAILRNAGGSVIDYNTEKPLLYNKESMLNPHFIAYARKI